MAQLKTLKQWGGVEGRLKKEGIQHRSSVCVHSQGEPGPLSRFPAVLEMKGRKM